MDHIALEDSVPLDGLRVLFACSVPSMQGCIAPVIPTRGQKSVGQYTDVQGYGLKDTLCCLVLLRKRRIFSAFSFISARRA